MNKNNYSLLFVIIFLVSCGTPKDNKSVINSQSQIENTVSATSSDSIKTGIQLSITGKVVKNLGNLPKPKPLVNKKTVPAIKNVLEVGKPDKINVHDVISSRSGENGIGYPKFSKVYPDRIKSKFPKPAEALPPRFRDAAITNLQYMDVDQGMNSSYVFDVLEDKRGNFWFATYGGGISMYDGVNFYHFTEEQGLVNNFTVSIVEDNIGNLWIGTFNGLSMYDGDFFYNMTDKEGLINKNIESMMQDSRGDIWVGTHGGVSRLSANYDPIGHTLEFDMLNITEKEGLNNNVVWDIIEDREQNIWLSTNEGIGRLNLSGSKNLQDSSISLTHFTEKNGLINNSVWAMIQDTKGAFWLGTNSGGLSKLILDKSEGNSGTFYNYSSQQNLIYDWIWSLNEDNQGNIWIGSYGGGVSKYQKGNDEIETFTHYTENEGISNNFIVSIKEDKRSRIWFGTYGGGVCWLDHGNIFNQFTTNSGLSNQNIATILEDAKGNLWFGSEGGGVNKFNSRSTETTITHYTEEQGLIYDYVTSMTRDRKENIWIGSFYGIDQLVYNEKEDDYTEIIHFGEEQGIPTDNIWALLEDTQGNMWMGFENEGLMKLNPESGILTKFSLKEGFISNSVYSIIEDKKGNIWVGAYGGGLTKMVVEGDEMLDQVTYFSEKEGLSSNYITYLFEDSNGHIWSGTEGGGVSKFNPDDNTFKNITVENGLSNNYGWTIQEAKNGDFWVSTESGLNVLRMNADGDFDIEKYEKSDGLTSPDFYQSSGLIDSENKLWLGGGKNLVMMDLNIITNESIIPIPQITGIGINNLFIDFRSLSDTSYSNSIEFGKELISSFDSIIPFYNIPNTLKLPYDINHLTFDFSAIDWTNPQKIEYEYRLIGLEDNWNIRTKTPTADFRNLSYGSYIFQLRAISGAKKWSDTLSYSFQIERPWWHSWWTRTGYGIVAMIMFIVFARWRTQSLNRRQRALKRMVDKKTADLAYSNAKLEHSLEEHIKTQHQLIQSEKMASLGQLSAGIAHELNNPISAMYSGSKILEKDLDDIFKLIEKYQVFENGNTNENTVNEINKFKESIDYDILTQSITDTINHLQIASDRTMEIIRGLRSYSRMDAEEKVYGDIHEGLNNTLLLLKTQLIGRIEVKLDYDPQIKAINCFYGQLNQVFMNLITNAIDAIEGDGEILIATKLLEDNSIKIIIKDSGSGMTDDVKNKIFDPFFTTKDVGKGTGLGLSISNNIIEKHNGKLKVESTPGENTAFTIILPLGD